jgi:hypothetical protein
VLALATLHASQPAIYLVQSVSVIPRATHRPYNSSSPMVPPTRIRFQHETVVPTDNQYFSQIYPESLFSISGSSSDEVEISGPPPPDSNSKNVDNIDARTSSSTSTSKSTSTPSSNHSNPNKNTVTTISSSSHASSDPSSTPDSTTTPTSTSAPQRIYPAIEKLWPQLQALIEPYGLRRKDSEGEIIKGDDAGSREQQVEQVRREADDLRDAVEEAQAEQRSKKGNNS